MMIFDLICEDAAHQFEGWFDSSEEYEQQKLDGLLVCPVCDSANISKAVMVPNVGAKGNQKSSGIDVAAAQPVLKQAESIENSAVQVPAEYKELLGKLAKAQSEILEKSEWVGDELPEKARAMHYGDSEEKAVHGTATADDISDLEDEGIELAPLPFPVAPPETQN